jgi:2'-5' RNA ligase
VTVRAFVALPCPPGLRQTIARQLAEWREIDAPIAWGNPASAHLTLRFLGSADTARLDALQDRLGELAASAGPIHARPGPTGAFPGWERPRVLWLAVESGGAIERLAGAVESATRDAGFDAEERPFTAHLTLGRVRGQRGTRQAVRAVRGWAPAAPAEPIPEMILFRSELHSAGARHIPLARYSIR